MISMLELLDTMALICTEKYTSRSDDTAQTVSQNINSCEETPVNLALPK